MKKKPFNYLFLRNFMTSCVSIVVSQCLFRKLRSQLTKTVNTLIMDEALHLTPKMDLPPDVQAKLLCQIVLSGKDNFSNSYAL